MMSIISGFIFCAGVTCNKSGISFFKSITKESIGHYKIDTIAPVVACTGMAQDSTRLIKVNWHKSSISIELCSKWSKKPNFKCSVWVDGPFFLNCYKKELQEIKNGRL